MVDKVRIKKNQQPKVNQWSAALDVTVSRFVEDALTFYIRYLEGKPQFNSVMHVSNCTPDVNAEPQIETSLDIYKENEDEDDNNFTGDIEL